MRTAAQGRRLSDLAGPADVHSAPVPPKPVPKALGTSSLLRSVGAEAGAVGGVSVKIRPELTTLQGLLGSNGARNGLASITSSGPV